MKEVILAIDKNKTYILYDNIVQHRKRYLYENYPYINSELCYDINYTANIITTDIIYDNIIFVTEDMKSALILWYYYEEDIKSPNYYDFYIKTFIGEEIKLDLTKPNIKEILDKNG